ncbi:MAG: histidinol dehydrogenase [Nitrososphaeria archaeon]|nr:histidinol dehydrogenase [Nitrosopumilaceae archaeon]NIP10479.1 histidinol dehydrogenase [Nitrosopumilaceae archaeon]NIP90861.1 histidinol dehydrogenase [Nitrososphaeria archaeon]NIS95122.1 histidinol dehydrogenase [Nitrosopumilaceae archaeon]
MKIIQVTNVEKFASEIIPKQPQKNKKIVESILKKVQKDGDSAIRKFEKKFSGAKLTTLRISQKEKDSAYSKVSSKEITAIKLAKKRLEKTEYKLKSILKQITINNEGIKISKTFVPITSAGCYIPGGLAKYPSSVIMSVIPAKVAGVKKIIITSPPNSSGKLDPLTIVAADICGVDEIYKIGGAQAIAALAYGTKSIPKVEKIVGPGGAFVTAAKSMVSNNTSIDMLAGPTELGIIADNSANPKFVALDLISQAEHSNDTFCYLITNSEKLAKSVNQKLEEMVGKIQRSEIVRKSLKQNGFIAVCKKTQDVMQLANELAPEHLQIMTKNPQKIASKLTSPGLVLLGDQSPSSASDYMLGSNHILPTNGFGKTRGSLSVLDFMKISTQVTSTRASLSKISKYLDIFTKAEGLPNHFEAVRGRLE